MASFSVHEGEMLKQSFDKILQDSIEYLAEDGPVGAIQLCKAWVKNWLMECAQNTYLAQKMESC